MMILPHLVGQHLFEQAQVSYILAVHPTQHSGKHPMVEKALLPRSDKAIVRKYLAPTAGCLLILLLVQLVIQDPGIGLHQISIGLFNHEHPEPRDPGPDHFNGHHAIGDIGDPDHLNRAIRDEVVAELCAQVGFATVALSRQRRPGPGQQVCFSGLYPFEVHE
ncbi:hypothetical protein [Croceicoccus estronivorus]|uniref:hypothetical protein n=1 Tax=Croceicoccus estronivorus TaxID=1172626 RepID=UPI001478E540|nr:hypothetical protein [Croceicoccus estronivorus]